MTDPEKSSGYGEWHLRPGAFAIRYPISLLHEIDFNVKDAARRISHGGMETGGFLFGRTSTDGQTETVQIEAFRPIDCEHAFGPSFVLSERDLAKMREQLLQAGSDPALEGMRLLGWFVGHARNPLRLSDHEASLFDRLFPRPGQLTLLVKPERFAPSKIAFLVRAQDRKVDRDGTRIAFSLPPLSAPAPKPEEEKPEVGIIPADSTAQMAEPLELGAPVQQPAETPKAAEVPSPPEVTAEPVPEPVIAEPVPTASSPAPIVAEPTSPEPVSPESAAPGPVALEPIAPKPIPEAIVPEARVPAPVVPTPVPAPASAKPADVPLPATPKPAPTRHIVPKPSAPEATRPEPTHTVPVSEPIVPAFLVDQTVIDKLEPKFPVREPVTPEPVGREPFNDQIQQANAMDETLPIDAGPPTGLTGPTPAADPAVREMVPSGGFLSLEELRTRRLQRLERSERTETFEPSEELAPRPPTFALMQEKPPARFWKPLIASVAALILCGFAFWFYQQYFGPSVPLQVDDRIDKILVSWPPDATRDGSEAALRVNGGPPAQLSMEEKVLGRAEIAATGDDIQVELIVHHWFGDARGRVRFLRPAITALP